MTSKYVLRYLQLFDFQSPFRRISRRARPSWVCGQSPYRPVRLREVVRWCWQPHQAQIHPQTVRVQSFTLVIRRGTFNAINSIRQVCIHEVTFFEESHFHFGQSTNESKLKWVYTSGLFFQRFWGRPEQPKAAPMLSFEGKSGFFPFFEFFADFY